MEGTKTLKSTFSIPVWDKNSQEAEIFFGSSKKGVTDLLNDADMTTCKSTRWCKSTSILSLVGKSIYVSSHARQDITSVVGLIGQFMHCAREASS